VRAGVAASGEAGWTAIAIENVHKQEVRLGSKKEQGFIHVNKCFTSTFALCALRGLEIASSIIQGWDVRVEPNIEVSVSIVRSQISFLASSI
jgi:hypothetical protein